MSWSGEYQDCISKESWQYLDGFWRVSTHCKESVWTISVQHLDWTAYLWIESGQCLDSIRTGSLFCLDSVSALSWQCLGRVWTVFGCIWTVFWQYLDRILSVSGQCLISIWTVFWQNLDSFLAVSGQCLGRIWTVQCLYSIYTVQWSHNMIN